MLILLTFHVYNLRHCNRFSTRSQQVITPNVAAQAQASKEDGVESLTTSMSQTKTYYSNNKMADKAPQPIPPLVTPFKPNQHDVHSRAYTRHKCYPNPIQTSHEQQTPIMPHNTVSIGKGKSQEGQSRARKKGINTLTNPYQNLVIIETRSNSSTKQGESIEQP
ncbi:hypothetical protein L2E82_20734 [Cichorium intybus]|uniref:Uncharacterized protein n=1 Tax=Cichorium intybus TaxID=13427 RepID=A0ACB9DTY4_CICIN|nr:hypothetical protein L2E82_20734 [Cichorium intybus]